MKKIYWFIIISLFLVLLSIILNYIDRVNQVDCEGICLLLGVVRPLQLVSFVLYYVGLISFLLELIFMAIMFIKHRSHRSHKKE